MIWNFTALIGVFMRLEFGIHPDELTFNLPDWDKFRGGVFEKEEFFGGLWGKDDAECGKNQNIKIPIFTVTYVC